MHQYWFINCNKCKVLIIGETGGLGDMGTLYYLLDFFCKSKTSKKIKSKKGFYRSMYI